MPVGATLKLGDTEIVFGKTHERAAQPHQAPAPRPAQVPVQASNDPAATKVIGKQKSALWLAVTTGPDTGSTVQLSAGDNFIGRGQENGLVLGDSYVSSRHAMVRVENGKSYLFDVGSKGGTKVNGTRIDGHVVGANGMIRLGETELCLVSVDRVQQGAPNAGNGGTRRDRKGQSGGGLGGGAGGEAGGPSSGAAAKPWCRARKKPRGRRGPARRRDRGRRPGELPGGRSGRAATGSKP